VQAASMMLNSILLMRTGFMGIVHVGWRPHGPAVWVGPAVCPVVSFMHSFNGLSETNIMPMA
jgi:hypothetical protein